MKLKQIIPITLISATIFSGCGSSDENPSTEITTAAKIITTEAITTEIATIETTTQKIETTTSEPIAEINPIISNLQEKDIMSGSGTTFIGKYLVAKMPENSFTDNDLIEFYNYCKENNSAYNYILIEFGDGNGIWYSSGILSKAKFEFDTQTGSGYRQYETFGYYNVNNNTITYEPIE